MMGERGTYIGGSLISPLNPKKAQIRRRKTSFIHSLVIPKPFRITFRHESATLICQRITARLRFLNLLEHTLVRLIVEELKTVVIMMTVISVPLRHSSCVDTRFLKTQSREVKNRGVCKGWFRVGDEGVLILEVGEVVGAVEAAVLEILV